MTETPRQESGESRQNTQDAHNELLHEAPEGIVSETNSEANDFCENEAIEKELQAFLDGEALTEGDLEKRIEALLPDEAEGDASEHAAAETKESAPAEGGENSQPESDASAADSWDEPEDSLWSKDDAPAASADTGKTQAERDAEDKKLRAESYQIMANMGNFALYLVIALVFTWFIGSAMDNFFGTTPVFTIFWIFCGIASTVLEVRKTLIAAKKLGEADQK